MIVLVCFAIEPDISQLHGRVLSLDENNKVYTEHLRDVINPYDESALEFALRLREKAKQNAIPVELHALTIGGENTEIALKTLLALQFDKVFRIEAEQQFIFSPDVIADAICHHIETKGGYDMILLGQQTTRGNNGKTPFLISESLGLPCIDDIIEVELKTENRLIVKSELPRHLVTQTISTPVILTTGNNLLTKLRVPTLKDRMVYGKRAVNNILLSSILTEEQNETLSGDQPVHLSVVEDTRESIYMDGSHPQDIAHWLLEQFPKSVTPFSDKNCGKTP